MGLQLRLSFMVKMAFGGNMREEVRYIREPGCLRANGAEQRYLLATGPRRSTRGNSRRHVLFQSSLARALDIKYAENRTCCFAAAANLSATVWMLLRSLTCS